MVLGVYWDLVYLNVWVLTGWEVSVIASELCSYFAYYNFTYIAQFMVEVYVVKKK